MVPCQTGYPRFAVLDLFQLTRRKLLRVYLKSKKEPKVQEKDINKW